MMPTGSVPKELENFLCHKRQVAKLVRAVVPQEIADEQRNSANWEECKGSIATLQKDLQGFCDVQVKMGHKAASLINRDHVTCA